MPEYVTYHINTFADDCDEENANEEIFLYNFFPICKNFELDIIRKTKKGFEKRLVKGIKIFQKKKNKKRKYDREQYSNLSEEEKNEKRQYGRERYRNLSEHRNNFSKIQKIKTG